MSRAFVKEDDQEEAPFIPPRAPLAPSEPNYVTPSGYEALEGEKEDLEKQKEEAYQIEDEYNKRRQVATINGKLKLLEERMNSARILHPEDQPKNEVRFGAKVAMTIDGKNQTLQLVGADEADVQKGKIAFFSPLAKSIIGKKVHDEAVLSLGKNNRKIKILAINY